MCNVERETGGISEGIFKKICQSFARLFEEPKLKFFANQTLREFEMFKIQEIPRNFHQHF